MNNNRFHKGFAWALVPVALLGTMFVGWGVMVSLALDDPAFAIEPDYYDKAVHFDEHRAEVRESRELGWSLDVRPQLDAEGARVLVTLKDREQRPIPGASVKATVFHNARSSQWRQIDFRDDGHGNYTQRLTPWRPGLWELRFDVQHGGQRFLQVTRLSLGDAHGA